MSELLSDARFLRNLAFGRFYDDGEDRTKNHG
jgi:hypothetical protein